MGKDGAVVSGCYAIRCNDEMQCGHCGLQWRVDDTDPPVCDKGTPVVEDAPAVLEMEIFDASALVKKLSSGVRLLSHTDARMCCAIARAAYEEGIAQTLKAVRRLPTPP